MKITPSNIMRALCIGFLIGIMILSWSLNLDKEVQWIWLSGFAIVIGILFFYSVNRIAFVLLIVFLCGGLFGSAWYLNSFPKELSVSSYANQELIVDGTVADIRISNGWQKIVLSDLSIDNSSIDDRMLVITLPYPEYEYGDLVRVRCELQSPEVIEDFAYDRYLASKDIYATCFTYNVLLVDSGQGGAKSALLDLRSKFINGVDQIFGEPQGSLLVGLLLGEQRFTEIWKERFLQTGTTHIVAASGYNISVVLWIAMGFFASIRVKRQKAFAFLIASVAGYILLAGADAAVFRAGVMGIVLIIAHQSGRKTSMLNILLLTASIMLIINPRLLRDDVGFQLSMMSTIGLIYLSPIFQKKLKWLPKQLAIQESVLATLVATFISLPIILLQFGEFSLVSLFANVFVLPWIPIAMASGILAVLFGFLSIKLGAIVSGFAWLSLTVMLYVVELFASLDLFARSIHWTIVVLVLITWLVILLKLIFKSNNFLVLR